jgi:hypothetical protein
VEFCGRSDLMAGRPMPFRAWVTLATDPPLCFPVVLLAERFAILPSASDPVGAASTRDRRLTS